MVRWEAWVYGEGSQGRIQLSAGGEHAAAKRFLNRHVLGAAGYMTFSAALEERGVDRVKICVKDPARKGSQEHPNYPTVYTFADDNGEEWRLVNTS
jgi:hypothetical protein